MSKGKTKGYFEAQIAAHKSPKRPIEIAKQLGEQRFEDVPKASPELMRSLKLIAELPVSERKLIRFTIPGEPVSAPRMTQQDKWMKRPCVVRYREWSNEAKRIAGDLPDPSRIESLSWSAYFEPSESWPKKKRVASVGTLHRFKPDRDNLDKAVLDSLFKNDAAIARGSISKWWDWTPRLEVEIVWY